MENSQSIIFFDGVCNLCNGFVNFLLRTSKGKFSFAPLQGSTARKILPEDLRGELSSVVYFRNGNFFVRGRAVIEVLKDIGGIYGFLGRVMGFLPEGFADRGYRIVAHQRYSVFGKRDTCRLPNENEKPFFLS